MGTIVIRENRMYEMTKFYSTTPSLGRLLDGNKEGGWWRRTKGKFDAEK